MAGELIIKNGLRVSGSIMATAGLTGSFSGSISNATTASYALTASALLGSVTSASFASTASYWSGSVLNTTSASYSLTASFASTSSFPWFQTGSNITYIGNNVGIAETNPRLRFTINTPAGGYWISMDRGNTTEGGNNPTWAVFNNADPASATYGWAWYDSSADGSFSLWRRSVSTTSSLVVKFDRNNGNTSFAANVRITGSATNSLLIKGSGTTSGTTAFRVENSSTTPSLTVLDNGFVGIRRSNPAVALDVSGSAIISGSVTVWNTSGIALFDGSGNGGGRVYGSYGYLNGEVYIRPLGANSDTFVFSPNNGMSIGGFTIGGTAGSPPAYGLTVSGSVGIGTRMPITQLDVSGSGRFTSNLTITGSVIAASFTGSLLGTASLALTASYWSGSILNATSASYALSSSFAVSSSRAVSSSFTSTASYWSGSVVNSTSASFASTASSVSTLNQSVIATGNIESQATLKSMYQAGDEGGELFLNAPATNTTIPNGVTIDVYQNRLRIFEQGGSANGYYLDMPSGAPGVGTDLKPVGYTGTVNILGNPPGQQFLNFTDGILISVT